MQKKLRNFFTTGVLGFFFIWSLKPSFAEFEESPWNAIGYLLPPGGSVMILREKIENPSSTRGKMMFAKPGMNTIEVPKKVMGVKVINGSLYEAEVKEDTIFTTGEMLELKSGSIHLRGKAKDEKVPIIMDVGTLRVSFLNADFLSFVSGDGKEKLIKVLEGDVTVEHLQLKQKAVVSKDFATATDVSGRLLIPFLFGRRDSLSSPWWLSKHYHYLYRRLPIAHAGEDQRVLGNIPTVLDGSVSEYKTGDIFEWTLKKGPKDEQGKEILEVPFDSTNIVKPLFTPKVDGEYYFSLQITNVEKEVSNFDEAIVFVGKKYLKPLWIYPDVPTTHPHNLAITYLYKKNVMRGSEDKKTGKTLFRPEEIMNRVEVLKTVLENKRQKIPSLDEVKAEKAKLFSDVRAEHWFAPYILAAKKLGLVEGSDGLYRPADQVLFVEAIKILALSFQINLDEYRKAYEIPYPDAELNAWYNPLLFFVKKYNVLDPDLQGNINPGKPITRAQFAEMLYRLESISLAEKRGYLMGKLKRVKTGQGVPQAEIFISTVVEDQRGELYYKTATKNDGTFSVSLPIGTKYYIEGLLGDTLSTKSIITELQEEKTTRIELEILIRE